MKTKKHGIIVILPNGKMLEMKTEHNILREIVIAFGVVALVVIFAVLFFSC